MALLYSSNITDSNIIEFTTSTIVNEKNLWNSTKSFFTLQNSMIILAIICSMFFFITLCLIFIIINLAKTKRSYQNPTKTISNNLPNNYPKLDRHLNFTSSPNQIGLTSNQIASLGNIIPINKDIKIQESSPTIISSTSLHESNKTQSFDNFEHELKRTWNEKGITSNPSLTNDDEVETVNEVLEMEERNGKVYYKVNFTGHPSDYTAWVCEEDLIPE
ncbi:unnamed protein product [Adineta steineri]|uniref:Chromo domain-containing protein n=1 Tax=Adineta steineri TaxID=433720 RepID=A0A814BSD1_9BILA|nr:unnamed protein product [Adineta steineri]